ncbi:MAG: shikimate kinase [Mariprofundaceae bacterium]|nr:shikimate kinase [Mariprofundaceae bacterium]
MAYKSHLILIGLMGVGKSTIGRQLASCVGTTFIDTDHVIEDEQQSSISDLFEQHGEAYFRQLEKKALHKLVHESHQYVIATGGGMVIQKQNRDCMQQHGVVIWLNVEPEAIYQRVRGNKNRPLLQQTDALRKLQDLYVQREAWYRSCCDLEIKSGSLTPRQVVDQITQFMAEFRHEKATISS